MPRRDESYRQRLERSYTLAIWLTVLLIAGIMAGTAYLASTASSGPEILNLAGRQRMLSQRILAHGILVLAQAGEAGREGTAARLVEAAHAMEAERNHMKEHLHHSRAALSGMLAREDAAARQVDTDKAVTAFLALARTIPAAAPALSSAERIATAERLGVMAEALLPRLNQAVDDFQAESERVTQSIRAAQAAALLAVLLLLWLEVRYIFRPMVRDVVAKTDLAESVMADLARQTERAEEINARLLDEAARSELSRRELGRLNAYLLGLVGVEGVSIIATDADGLIQIFNPGAERLLGYAAGEVVGLATPEMFHDPEEFGARLRELDEPVALGLSTVTWLADRDGREMREWTYMAKDGTRKAVALSVSPLRDEQGGRVGHIFVGVDITALKTAEKGLKVSEARFKAMADSSHDAQILVDDAGRVIFWSRQAERLLGWTEAEAMGADLHGMITPPELREEARQGLERFARTGTGPVVGNVLVFDALRKDGTVIPVERAVNAFQHDGRWYAVGSLRDVSERRRTDRELKFSRERLELALAGGELGLWDWNTATDVIHTNEQWSRMLGYESSELPTTFSELMRLVHPEDVAKVQSALADHFKGDKPAYRAIIRMRSKDGDWVWILSTGKIMERGPDASPSRVVGTHLDITQQKTSEQLLREYSQLFDLVQEMARLGAWSVDMESGQLDWTREVFRIHGLEEGVAPTREEALKFFAPEDRPYIKAAVEQAMTLGAPYDLELRLDTADGRRIWVRAMGRAQFDQGRIVRIYGLLQDIDARKRGAERMRDLADRLEHALAGSGSGLWDWDVATGEVFLDKQWMALRGYEEGELPGAFETWRDSVHPEDFPGVMHGLEKALAQDSSSYYEAEYRMRRKDGSWMWVVDRGKVVGRDMLGKPLRMIGIIQDVSGRKNGELRMRELSERLEQALVGSESGLWDWNVTTGHVYLDPLWERLMGYDPGELAPHVETWKKTIHPEDLPAVISRLEQSLTPGTNVLYEVIYRARMKSGEWRWTLSRGRVVERDVAGKAVRMIGIIQDASARVVMEQELRAAKELAEEADRAKSDFLARMSHEIRTPMNAVLGLAHLTLKTDLTARQRDYVTKLGGSARHLLGIINDILDFSKIEAGKLILERTEFDLEESFRNLLDIVSVTAAEKGLEINLDVGGDVPVRLVGDPLRLGQVLINLCNNAVKFTERGEIVISASLAGHGPDGIARLRFAVRDTGIGMGQEQVERLFQPFSQADESTTRRFGGTGLGLAISRRLVELMGGSIEARSEPGKGSEFSFTVPLGIAKEREAHFSCVRLAGLRALVADDSATARKTAARYLEGFCIDVDVAGDGATALDMVSQSESGYALLVLDWRMPGLDGLELTRAVRGLPLSEQPRIILISAHSRAEIADRALAAGADVFLAKPFNQSMLFDTVMEIFKTEPDRIRESMPVEATATDLGRLRGMRVLLAEDNAINQQVGQEILEQAGITVDIAVNGREAVDKAREGGYDAVLMDIQMPVMDGLEATRVLRGIPGFAGLPIIAMTAHALSGDRERSLAAGMNGHVTKPVDPFELFAELLRYAPSDATGEAPGGPSTAQAPETLAMPGLDVPSALARLGGNARLLRRLLADFARDYAEAAVDLRGLLAAGQRDEAARLAHTVKGVAGNLGLVRVQRTSAALDDAFKAGQAPSVMALDDFDTALSEAVAGGRGMAAAESGPPARPAGSLEPATVVGILDRLDPLLRSSSMDADAAAEEAVRLLRGGPHDTLAAELERAVGSFDFEAALTVSQRLRAALRGGRA